MAVEVKDKVEHKSIFIEPKMFPPSYQYPLLVLTKNRTQIIDINIRKACKILKFTSDWTLDEIANEISELNFKTFENLIVIIIGHESFELTVENGKEKKLKLDTVVSIFEKSLKNFNFNRTIYLQITTKLKKEPQFYCRNKESNDFWESKADEFVNAIDHHLLSIMLENDKFLNTPQRSLQEIDENHLNLIKNYQILQNNFKVLYEIEDENEAGPSSSTAPPPKTVKVNKFRVVQRKNLQVNPEIPEKTLNNIKSHKFALISKNINSNQSWIFNNMTKKLKELNLGMLNYCVDLQKLQEKVEAENCEIDFMTLVADHIATKNSKLEAEIFKKLYKNGKVCIFIAEFKESDPNCAEFLASFCNSFEINLGNQLWMTVKDHFEINSGDNLGLEVMFHLNDPKNIKPEIAEHRSSIFQRTLRNSIDKNFETSEVLNILNSNDSKIDNLIFINFISTLELTEELTIEKVPKVLDNSDLIKTFENISEDSETILHILVKKRDLDNLRCIWKKLQNLIGSADNIKMFLNHQESENHENFLHIVSRCDSLEIHQVIWDLLMKAFDDRQELLNFILQKNKFDFNFIHCIAVHGNLETFEFALEKLKEIFSSDQCQAVIESKGQLNRNLIQLLTVKIKDTEIYQNIWNLCRSLFKSGPQFVKFVLEPDKNGQTVFHLAAGHSSIEILKFIHNKIFSMTSLSFAECELFRSDSNSCNMLQIAAAKMQPLKFQSELWNLVKSWFSKDDYWMMLNNVDNFGDNVLCKAIQLHTTEVVEFMWTQIKSFLMENGSLIQEYSNMNKISEKNWTQLATEYNLAVLDLCEEMQKEYEIFLLITGTADDVNILDELELNQVSFIDQPTMPQPIEVPQPFNEVPATVPSCTEHQPAAYISNPEVRIIKILYNEMLLNVEAYKPEIHPNLFMIIIEKEDFKFSDSSFIWSLGDIAVLQNYLTKLHYNRSFFLKLTSLNENESKYFFKEDKENEFWEILDVDFVGKIEIENLKFLAEFEEILMSSETIIKDKFIRIFYQMRKFTKSCKKLSTLMNGNCKNSSKNQENSKNSTINSTKNAKLIKLTDEELIKDTKTQKFILISGKASSGKTWNLRNFKFMLQNSNSSVKTFYVDLKQFNENLKSQFNNDNFESFMIDYIFSRFTKFESEIFKKLYKNGKVWILFDGFYATSSECAEIFIKICKKLKQNGGNQLWIAINDEFEESFKSELEIENVYKLDEFQAAQTFDVTEECRKILQTEVGQRKPLEYHQSLWKIVKNFFNSAMLCELIKHSENDDDNLVIRAANSNSKEVIALALSEINKILTQTSENAFFNYIQQANKHSETIFHLIVKQNNPQSLEHFYEAIKSFLTSQQLMTILTQQTTTKYENIIQLATKSKYFEFHNALWKILFDAFADRQELLKLILQKNRFGDNFPHYLVVHDRSDIIFKTFDNFMKTFEPNEFQQIFKSKGYLGRNLLQAAAVSARDTETHHILWHFFMKICSSVVEFAEYLQEVDDNGNNIFHLAACFTTNEIFEFMILELENLISQEEIKKILSNLGLAGKNLFQSAARQNHSIDLHKTLWEIIRKYFGTFEVWRMITHADEIGDNVLADVIECNNREIVEYTYIQIKKFLYRSDIDYCDLNVERFGGRNLLQLALQNTTDPDVYKYCESMLSDYSSLVKMSESFKYAKVEAMPPPTEYKMLSLRQQQKQKLSQGKFIKRP